MNTPFPWHKIYTLARMARHANRHKKNLKNFTETKTITIFSLH